MLGTTYFCSWRVRALPKREGGGKEDERRKEKWGGDRRYKIFHLVDFQII